VEIHGRIEFLRVGYSQLFFCPKFSFLACRGADFVYFTMNFSRGSDFGPFFRRLAVQVGRWLESARKKL